MNGISSSNTKTKLVIGNLNKSLNEENLNSIICQYSEVISIRIPRTPNNKSKGFGIVEFKTEKDAKFVKDEFDGREMYGKKVVVRFEDEARIHSCTDQRCFLSERAECDDLNRIKAWKSIEETKADIYSFIESYNGFCSEYIDFIGKRIKATSKIRIYNPGNLSNEEREKIEETICLLCEAENNLNSISMHQSNIIHCMNSGESTLIENAEKGDSIAKALMMAHVSPSESIENIYNLIKFLKDKRDELGLIIYGTKDQDLAKSVCFSALKVFLGGR